ncbi:hypothetical protein MKK75_02965 [Methylobacterium sp. J-030]|uniref:hypothetical protein n=1 Tax=Methylobacterium sp. J-030 TaxID=2836627 RepID=UPI001FBAB87B|nr:hypothetical protein [Methylobacterium sp. J-030]MCJ2067776.1 hypothetical protein [Methylobacterium sp. J-030]
MDGLILEFPAPEHVSPFVPPVCLSPMTAQILAIALVILLCGALIPSKAACR